MSEHPDHEDMRALETALLVVEMAAREASQTVTDISEFNRDVVIRQLAVVDPDSLDHYVVHRVQSVLAVSFAMPVFDIFAVVASAISEGVLVGMLAERSRHEVIS